MITIVFLFASLKEDLQKRTPYEKCGCKGKKILRINNE